MDNITSKGKRRRFLLKVDLPALLAFILFAGMIFLYLIPGFEKVMMDRKRNLIHEMTASVYSLLEKPRWERVAMWMGIGAAQFLLCGAGALAYSLVAPERARELGAQALGGLGKVFWMKPFREQLYGVNLVS